MMDDFVINDEQPMRGTLIDAIRVIREYINRPPEPENTLIGTKTGTIITADDAFSAIPKGAKAYGKSTQDGTPTPETPVPIMSVDDLTLNIVGKNLFGGTAFKDAILAINPNSVTGSDANGSYVTNPTNATMNGATVLAGPFKSNTVYTIILAAKSSSSSAHAPNIWVYYTDGTYSYLTQVTNTYSVSVFSTASNRTVKRIAASWSTGTDYYYYDSCGIFEGVLTADQFEPYVGQSIPIPLSNHVGRSLPDGTRDTLTLSYVAPSTEHEGWGVFGAELVQRVGLLDLGTKAWTKSASNDVFRTTFLDAVLQGYPLCASFAGTQIINPVAMPDNSISLGNSQENLFLYVKSAEYYSQYDATQFRAAVNGVIMHYPMLTPVTHDLGTVELPILPAPNFTFFANGGNAQPDVQISYERDITIVIDKLEAAETPVGTLGISPAINHSFEPSIQTQEETEWQSDSI